MEGRKSQDEKQETRQDPQEEENIVRNGTAVTRPARAEAAISRSRLTLPIRHVARPALRTANHNPAFLGDDPNTDLNNDLEYYHVITGATHEGAGTTGSQVGLLFWFQHVIL